MPSRLFSSVCPRHLVGALLSLATGTARAEDWPQWRGLARDGRSPETGLLREWPASGPPRLWVADRVGEGFSSVSVVAGRLFTMGSREDHREYVLCYDDDTGEEIWATSLGPGYVNHMGYHGPRSTPTVVGERLFALGASGELVCLNTSDGERLWGFNLLERFGGENISWGLSESPLVSGRRLVVQPGAPQASVVALDTDRGSVLWTTPGPPAGYASAVTGRVGDVDQVVVFNSRALQGLRLETGERLWDHERVANGTANCSTPIVDGNRVFASSDYGTGCVLLELDAHRGRRVTARPVYFSKNMKNHHGGIILVEGHVYGFSSAILTCLELDSGRVKWRARSVGKGSVVYADDHLVCLGEGGKVALVEATARAYRERGRMDLGRPRQPTWAHPVIANGKLYLRRDGEIHCFDVRAKPSGS